MGYVFRIHDAKHNGAAQPKNAADVKDWTETNYIDKTFLPNIALGMTGDEMGTSIPSMFARLFYFQSAFKALNGSRITALEDVNHNTRVVSECLDLLELLYQHGNDGHLVIRHWDAAQQERELLNSTQNEHKRFADVISSTVAKNDLFNEIFIFYWKYRDSQLNEIETVIGGTSPLTLVFTSPNLKRQPFIGQLRRLDGTPMFDDNHVKSLTMRDNCFKRMLYASYIEHYQKFQSNAQEFNAYLRTCWNNDQNFFQSLTNVTAGVVLGNQYPAIKIQSDAGNKNVTAGGIPLYYGLPDISKSGYLIKPTKTIDGNRPLVLNSEGINDAVYMNTSRWNSSCKIDDTVRLMSLTDRVLPGGTGFKYPYLIWSDFLEDKIIKVAADKIDSNKFVTASGNDSCYFLLPLKKEFFNYFHVNDINKVVGHVGNKDLHLLEVVSRGNNRIEALLHVPVEHNGGSIIELKRIYCDDDIVDLSNKSSIVLGFFPFYKVLDKDLNIYSVMASGPSDISLDFYRETDVVNKIRVSDKVRTAGSEYVNQNKYYQVNEVFDFIQINLTNTSGLLIPNMKEVNVRNNAQQCSFAVDLGTTNTHIAYKNNRTIVSLDMSDANSQVVYSCAIDSHNGPMDDRIRAMWQYYLREFIPIESSKLRYPIMTAVCETSDFARSQPCLFGNISVGYNLTYETTNVANAGFQYNTEIKWAYQRNPQDAASMSRIANYCLETLWVMKNKALLDNGDDEFNLVLTFPVTMNAQTKQFYMNCWSEAKQYLKITNVNITTESESIAPYNFLANKVGGESMMNIDIGGATSDIIFVIKKDDGEIHKALYTSSMFGANDLWSDGLSIGGQQQDFANGFCQFVMDTIGKNEKQYPKEMIRRFNAQRNLTKGSSKDMMAFLFRYDDVFKTTHTITNENKLHAVVFIYYAALLYHVARLIKKMEVNVPGNISFTGMGSLVLNLISNDSDDIKELTEHLWRIYTGQSHKFYVHKIQNPKEVTAIGALHQLDDQHAIPAGSLSQIWDYGFDTDRSDLKYCNRNDDDVKASVLKEYEKFIDSLNDMELKDFLYKRLGINLDQTELLKKMKSYENRSYIDVSSGIHSGINNLTLDDTLFFWPLKLAFSALSNLKSK